MIDLTLLSQRTLKRRYRALATQAYRNERAGYYSLASAKWDAAAKYKNELLKRLIETQGGTNEKSSSSKYYVRGNGTGWGGV